MRRLYCIPTHRRIDFENLQDLFREAEHATTRGSDEVFFLFFDDTAERTNFFAFEELCRRHPALNPYYIDRQAVRLFYQKVKRALDPVHREIFQTCYPTPAPNFGRMANKLSIFACAFSADCLHRRDSTVQLDHRADSGEYAFPFDIESRYLGTREGRTSYVVGGGQKGKYSVDLEALLIDGDFSLIRELLACMSVPAKLHHEIIVQALPEQRAPLIDDEVRMDSCLCPDSGNMAYYRLFRELPCANNDAVPGTDYFPAQVAAHAALGLTYHNRAVLSRPVSRRQASPQKRLYYWRSLLQLIDSQVLYSRFFAQHLKSRAPLQFSEEGDSLSGTLASRMQEFDAELPLHFAEREEKINRFLALLLRTKDPSLEQISETLRESTQLITSETSQMIAAHARLLWAWPAIIAAVSSVAQSSEGAALLNFTRIHK